MGGEGGGVRETDRQRQRELVWVFHIEEVTCAKRKQDGRKYEHQMGKVFTSQNFKAIQTFILFP